MSQTYVYRADQELPALALEWLDRDGAIVDFSTGWTFTVKLSPAGDPGTVKFSKTTGVTGAATLPNLLVDWAVTDWAALVAASGALPAAGRRYLVHVYARRTADTKDRVFSPEDPPVVLLLPAPA